MATMNANVPPQVHDRIRQAGAPLGEFRRIFEDNEHNTASSNVGLGLVCLGLGLADLVFTIIMIITTEHYFVKLAFLIPILIIAGIVFLIRGAIRGKGGREYIGVFDGGLVATREKQDAVSVVRYAASQVNITSRWGDGNKGHRAMNYTLHAVDGTQQVNVGARTDAGMIELNDVLTRFPGQTPIMRQKEPKYAGQ